MKLINFFENLFSQKSEYIGLTSFKQDDTPVKKEIKKERISAPEKTTLTGMLKRV